MVEVLGVVHGLGYSYRDGCVCAWCSQMNVSREKFTRDMLMAQQARKCAEKEYEAMQIIDGLRRSEEISVYESYMHNKRYLKGRKCTKFQYQC